MENTTNYFMTDREVLEIDREQKTDSEIMKLAHEITYEEKAKEQVGAAFIGMDAQLQREMDVLKEMTRKLNERLEADKEAQIEQEIKQAQAKAEQEVRQKAMNEGRIESPVQAAYKELLKGITK